MFASWDAAGEPARRCIDVLRAHRHGDLPRWLDALDALPELPELPETPAAPPCARRYGAQVAIGAAGDLPPEAMARLEAALAALAPWRKGPFRLFGLDIDSEWRSDRKWERIAPHVDLAGRRVLDAGCGNGYYGWRMLDAGAASVTGVDPSPLCVAQHAAIAYCARDARNLVLPLRLEELQPRQSFDAVFSMGVLYHHRQPARHVCDLARHAADGALLVLETLVADAGPLHPPGRYARMGNVRIVPDVPLLLRWLDDAGFGAAHVLPAVATTPDEQRATRWMPFESLADALDPDDPSRTVEGHPAPRRGIVIATKGRYA